MMRPKIITTLLVSLLVVGAGVVFSTSSVSAQELSTYNLPNISPYDSPNLDPIAEAGDDQSLTDADNDGVETTALDGTGSYDPDGEIVKYEWFGDSSLTDGDSNISGPTTEYGDTDTVLVATGSTPTIDVPTGSYTITLVVTDDDRAVSSDDVVINVASGDSEEEVTDIQLDTSAYKQKGKISVDLSWNVTDASQVDVYRDGLVIATTANDGAYTDNTGQKENTSFTYQVCEAGTTVCSNESTASVK